MAEVLLQSAASPESWFIPSLRDKLVTSFNFYLSLSRSFELDTRLGDAALFFG
jgi:hypothetical protein